MDPDRLKESGDEASASLSDLSRGEVGVEDDEVMKIKEGRWSEKKKKKNPILLKVTRLQSPIHRSPKKR